MPHKDPEARRKYQKEYFLRHKEKLIRERLSWARENVDKRRISANKYAAADRERARFSKMKSRYGITEDQFSIMLEEQNGQCAGCVRPFNNKTPHVDHNHATGKVRGLLCSNCNRGIGHLKEDISTMKRLIRYLCEHTEIDDKPESINNNSGATPEFLVQWRQDRNEGPSL